MYNARFSSLAPGLTLGCVLARGAGAARVHLEGVGSGPAQAASSVMPTEGVVLTDTERLSSHAAKV